MCLGEALLGGGGGGPGAYAPAGKFWEMEPNPATLCILAVKTVIAA